MMILTLSNALRSGIIWIFDPKLVEEAILFHRDEKTGKAVALSGHDDCVMAASITEMVAARTPLRAKTAETVVEDNFITKYMKKFYNINKGLKEGQFDDEVLGVEF